MTSKQHAVLWMGLILIILQVMTNGVWSSIWKAISGGSTINFNIASGLSSLGNVINPSGTGPPPGPLFTGQGSKNNGGNPLPSVPVIGPILGIVDKGFYPQSGNPVSNTGLGNPKVTGK